MRNLDLALPLYTMLGNPVRIYATDAGEIFPLHGAYEWEGEWYLCAWTADGRKVPEYHSSCDLTNDVYKPTEPEPQYA